MDQVDFMHVDKSTSWYCGFGGRGHASPNGPKEQVCNISAIFQESGED